MKQDKHQKRWCPGRRKRKLGGGEEVHSVGSIREIKNESREVAPGFSQEEMISNYSEGTFSGMGRQKPVWRGARTKLEEKKSGIGNGWHVHEAQRWREGGRQDKQAADRKRSDLEKVSLEQGKQWYA